MLNNDPKVRAILYWTGVTVTVLGIAFSKIPTPWAQTAAEGFESVALYLAGLIGLTGVTNLTAGNDVKLLEKSEV